MRYSILLIISIAAISLLGAAGFASPPVSGEPALCPESMAQIPGGEYLFGWDNGEPDERPERVELSQAYCVDIYEYPGRAGELPRDAVSYEEAAKICAGLGKRICSEKEWERACRGPRSAIYTPSQKYVKGECNLNSEKAAKSGEFASCVNGYGIYDMTGNLWEWADGIYSEETPWPIVKGGAYLKGPLFASCYARFTQPPDVGDAGQGFRCCSDTLAVTQPLAYGAKCRTARPQSLLRKHIMSLKRDPDVAWIYYVESSGGSQGAFARAVVSGKDDAKIIHAEIKAGKLETKEFKVTLKDAADLTAEYREPLLQKGAPRDAGACLQCGGICVYIFQDEKEIWTGDVYGIAGAFFQEPVVIDPEGKN